MARYSGATWKRVAWAARPRRRGQKANAIVNHIAVSSKSRRSLFDFFNNAKNGVCPHFFIDYYGGVEQHIDTAHMSACDYQGSNRTVSIEFGGGVGADINAGYSQAQMVAAVKLWVWLHKTHGIPLTAMKDSKSSSTGVAYHRLGVPRSKYVSASAPGWLIPGGEKWSTAVGKVCPGPGRIKQIPGMITDARAQAKGGANPPKPSPTTPAKKPPAKASLEWPGAKLLEDGVFGKITKRGYQRLLAPAKVGNYRGNIDADFSKLSVKAEQRWLKGLGYYTGLIDGWRGPMTIKALQRFLRDKGYYSGLIDGGHGSVTTTALQKYLNSQRRHYT